MDDLSGLDWKSMSNNTKPQAPSYPSIRPTPSPSNSGRSTPSAFRPPSLTNSKPPSIKVSSKPATPANDSFANLLSTSTAKSTSNLSLQERQKQLLEEKAKKSADERKRLDAQFGGQQHDAFWNGLGTGGRNGKVPSPARGQLSPHGSLSASINKPFAVLGGRDGKTGAAEEKHEDEDEDEDDILAAFRADAAVDASTNFPPQQSFGSGISTPASFQVKEQSGSSKPLATNGSLDFNDDDDPFGLNELGAKSTSSVSPAPAPTKDDDDILGMLGKPIEEVVASRPVPTQTKPANHRALDSDSDDEKPIDPRDKAVAELVDMGFPADISAEALSQTDSGMDVQAAVGILLRQAHEESRKKVQAREGGSDARKLQSSEEDSRSRDNSQVRKGDASVPAWMKSKDEGSRSASQNKNQSATRDKDVAQYASDIGNSFFKSANSLWKTGQKKVQKAVADFQQEGDLNQPKWMREAQLREAARGREKQPAAPPDITDEAMMLESGGARPQQPASPRKRDFLDANDKTRSQNASPRSFSDRSPGQSRPQSSASQRPPRVASRLTRQDLEADSPEVYVSPARRRKAQQTPTETPTSSTSSTPLPPRDTRSPLGGQPPMQSNNPFLEKAASRKPSRPASTPPPVRPKAPPRQIPPASSSALSTSTSHRQTGSDAFKRGDYSAAHVAYTNALQPLPSSHPVTIIIYCNRALTSLKNGDPKAAASDAESALSVIGISRGEGEKISLGAGEADKEMKEFYGKALMRKAEALEHMEKWTDAAKAWREAVEAGVGGSVSIQGRNRCEKAAGIGAQPQQQQHAASRLTASSSSSSSRPAPKPVRPKKPSALSDLAGQPSAVDHAASAEAVRKLREANAAAEKADDEKFALTDHVDAKLVAWKGTKADNLRALLGSLDKVLWPEAGWNKVGMQDLVMPNRVKIIYMKAIAKVHPDKISQSATTEQRMISGTVFATLNEAWDKFKNDNNL